MKRSEVLSLLSCYNFEKEFKKFSDKFIIKIDNKKYLDEIFWFIHDKCFMNYDIKSNYLWCRYYDFWEYFKIKFGFNSKQVKYLIKFMVEEHFKLYGVTPEIYSLMFQLKVEEHFKLYGVTPVTSVPISLLLVEEHFKLYEIYINK